MFDFGQKHSAVSCSGNKINADFLTRFEIG
jgi:hypothetical protein